MTALDYAQVYENEFRPRRRRMLRVVAWIGLAGLFLVRPGLALAVCSEAVNWPA